MLIDDRSQTELYVYKSRHIIIAPKNVCGMTRSGIWARTPRSLGERSTTLQLLYYQLKAATVLQTIPVDIDIPRDRELMPKDTTIFLSN